MIQLRAPDGSTLPIPEDNFVELVNDVDGQVIQVFMQLKPGVILDIRPGTSDAERYESLFRVQGVKFSQQVAL